MTGLLKHLTNTDYDGHLPISCVPCGVLTGKNDSIILSSNIGVFVIYKRNIFKAFYQKITDYPSTEPVYKMDQYSFGLKKLIKYSIL